MMIQMTNKNSIQYRFLFIRAVMILLFLLTFTNAFVTLDSYQKSFLTSNDHYYNQQQLLLLQKRQTKLYSQVSIEYCTGCRWGLRSFWLAQELLTTFQDDVALEAVTLIPSRPPMPGGMFFIQCWNDRNDAEVLWDRIEVGSFPDSKELKQLVRNEINPTKFLGHSDTKSRQDGEEKEKKTDNDATIKRGDQRTSVTLWGTKTPALGITYCTGCRWLYRAAYFGLEVLTTFDQEINSISLIPSRPPSKGGQFTISLNEEIIWDREQEGGFPEISELKRMLRDRLAPGKDLGHIDKTDSLHIEDMDDDDSEEARRFFGVA